MAVSKADAKSQGKSFNFDKLFAALRPKRPTVDNILFWYGPLVGGISYVGFSIHMYNPELLASSLSHGRLVLANCLLFNAHLGTGLYLYGSKHLSATTVPAPYRVMYSAYGSLMFNFGSILLWALSKSLLPQDGIFRTVFGLSSSICLLIIGKEYIGLIDNWCSKP